MPQQQAPFLEGKYGWNFGESGWDTGMNENLLKFSFMFDGNVDSIVASLPPVSNGAAHFNTTDNRFYFGVGTVWYSSPCPKSFIFKIKSNGHFYQFNGTSAVKIDNPSETDSRLSAVELTLSSLGTAAFQSAEDFATHAELDVVEGRAQGYTDALKDDLANSTDPAKGAGMVGYSGGTVADALGTVAAAVDALELRPASHPALISNASTATAKNVTLIGDSISHGAFALNTFMHGWTRVFTRMVNAEVGGSSYGFTPLLSLGSGPNATKDIHSVNFGGPSWTGLAPETPQCSVSPAGFAMRAGGVGSTITLSLPFFQNRCELHYIQQVGGGVFTVEVNGTLVATVDTAGTLAHARVPFGLTDAGYGSTSIVIAQTGAGFVDIIGPAYLSGVIEPVFNSWSQSGRRLRHMGEDAIAGLISESSMFIMALGHNDQGSADSDDIYYAEFVQRIDWLITYARQHNVKVVVPDFCWTAAESSRTRGELRRLATETGGTYINLPKMIFSGDVPVSTTYLIDTLKMWTDGSHPNKSGHKWIAETIARALGFSCCSKWGAIRHNDFWMPLPLIPATGVENANRVSAPLTSTYKRNGSEVLVRIFVKAAPSGAFPVGTYNLTGSWRPESELGLAMGQTGIGYVRTDTGAVVSVYSVASSGAITLNVLSAFINDQMLAFSAPLTVIL